MLDPTLIKGCKNSNELLLKLVEEYELTHLPLDFALQQVVTRLAMEYFEASSYIDLYELLIQRVLPDSKKFFLLRNRTSFEKDHLLRAVELAIIDHGKLLLGINSVSTVSKLLAEKYGTPVRMNVSYSENNKDKKVRALADEMMSLLEAHSLSLDVLIDSYLQHKNFTP